MENNKGGSPNVNTPWEKMSFLSFFMKRLSEEGVPALNGSGSRLDFSQKIVKFAKIPPPASGSL